MISHATNPFFKPGPGHKPRWPRPRRSFARVRVLATESIATPMVEGARTNTRAKSAAIIAPLGAICGLVLWALTGRAAETGVPADTEWALLGNGPEMQHHSNLAQINRKTVPNLGLAWAVDMPTRDGLVGNPLIRNGRIFQSGAHSRIFANDLRTGRLLWTHEPQPVGQTGTLSEAFGLRINRGVALHDDLVIVGTADCRLVAVDQEAGEKRWEAQACETEDGEVITAAPRVGGGMVFTGNGCLDMGVSRGHVDAFDASTGRRLWRFYTVPGDPHEPPENELYREAAMTWGDDWYAKTRGCGSVWDAMTYDAATERLYIGTGGSAPLVPTQRGEAAGDELYTNSIVALDAKTGEYLWHFKQTPQEGWNFEAAVGDHVGNLAGVGGGAACRHQRSERRLCLPARCKYRGVSLRAQLRTSELGQGSR